MLKQVISVLTLAFLALSIAGIAAPGLRAQQPLRIEITEGVIEPLPFAIPAFVSETAGAEQIADQITRLVSGDLTGTGLYREIPASAHISQVSTFAQPVAYADWRAINAQALVVRCVISSS